MDRLLALLNSLPQGTIQNKFKANGSQDLNDIMNLLDKSKSTPTYNFANMDRESGEYDPNTNKITLDPTKGLNQATVGHENEHALEQAMIDYYQGLHNRNGNWFNGLSPAEQQFHDNFDKLMAPTKLPMNTTDPYRTLPDEVRAFGVGNHMGTDSHRPMPHVDASAATDMSVLRDLYRRALNK